MRYDKQNWQTGEVITANKLNHIEDGIAGAGGGVLITGTTMEGGKPTLTNTWQEVFDAPLTVLPFAMSEDNIITLTSSEVAKISDSDYQISFASLSDPTNPLVFEATSADGYPTAQM